MTIVPPSGYAEEQKAAAAAAAAGAAAAPAAGCCSGRRCCRAAACGGRCGSRRRREGVRPVAVTRRSNDFSAIMLKGCRVMRLFVGLGNPGAKYQGNRHNIGFMAVDEIARRHGFAPWRRRFQGETAEGTLDRERVVLLKPTTFMNESGRAVQEAANFFKLAARRHHRVSRRARTAGGEAAGQDRRRHRRAQRTALDLRAYRQRLSPGADRDRSSRRSRNWCTATCCPISPRATGRGSRRLCEAIADNAGLLATGKDSTFQNKVHLAMQAKGFFEDKEDNGGKPAEHPPPSWPGLSRPSTSCDSGKEDVDGRDKPGHDDDRTLRTKWDSNAVSSDCPMSASRRCSTR